jgi:SAM-dependent methyltransferase
MLRGEREGDRPESRRRPRAGATSCARSTSWPAWDGGRFAVILPNCGLGEAVEVMDRVRAATPRGQSGSAGVARWDTEEPSELLQARCEQALTPPRRSAATSRSPPSSALAEPGRGRSPVDSPAVEPSTPETWDAFFSDFYLRAYADAERDAQAAEQALAAAQLAGCPEGGDLLDVPCGFGRHAIALGAAGYRVVGVDRSRPLLDEARRRAGGARWPKFVQGDYRRLPFAGAGFDAALCLFSSLGYLGDEEDTNALADIRRVLRPGGRLVIELLHRDLLVRTFREHDWSLLGEGRLLLEQRTFEPVSGVAQVTQTLIDGSGQRESRTFSVRIYTATELLAMLARAGFAETRCHGDLEGGPFDAGTRLVAVARAG